MNRFTDYAIKFLKDNLPSDYKVTCNSDFVMKIQKGESFAYYYLKARKVFLHKSSQCFNEVFLDSLVKILKRDL